MSTKKERQPFNICDQVEYSKVIRQVENSERECNKLLLELIEKGLASFLTFEIADIIIRKGSEGIKVLERVVIEEAQKRVLLTSEKEEAKARYTAFFQPFCKRADTAKQNVGLNLSILDLDLFVWNEKSKQIALAEDYRQKIEPLYMIEAKDYHYKYMELLDSYVKAKNELFRYHALTYSHDMPSMAGSVRVRGHFEDNGFISFDTEELKYTPISIEKLLLTNMHEPDSPDILKLKY